MVSESDGTIQFDQYTNTIGTVLFHQKKCVSPYLLTAPHKNYADFKCHGSCFDDKRTLCHFRIKTTHLKWVLFVFLSMKGDTVSSN